MKRFSNMAIDIESGLTAKDQRLATRCVMFVFRKMVY